MLMLSVMNISRGHMTMMSSEMREVCEDGGTRRAVLSGVTVRMYVMRTKFLRACFSISLDHDGKADVHENISKYVLSSDYIQY